MRVSQTQVETQNAALRYDRACGQLMAAKEMVYLAEQGYFCKGQPFDPAWQEMLNHATMKVQPGTAAYNRVQLAGLQLASKLI